MPVENSTATPPNPAADGDSAALRRSLRSARIAAREALALPERARRTAQIEAGLDALIGELAPPSLAFCWPWRGEVDLVPWVSRWLAGDVARRVALPVVVEAAAPMVFRRWQPGMDLEVDRHGIPCPADGEVLMPAAILVPLNVFDGMGYRLGYGGGYFDRTLAALDPPPLGIGVAFELARAETVFPQPHDAPMDWIVTEAGVLRVPAGPR